MMVMGFIEPPAFETWCHLVTQVGLELTATFLKNIYIIFIYMSVWMNTVCVCGGGDTQAGLKKASDTS